MGRGGKGAKNAVVERLCAELGIDQDELFRRAKERLRYACQQMMKERPKKPAERTTGGTRGRMTGGASRKVGWTWTRAGWKRVPRRLRQVKAVPLPSKRKAQNLPGEQGRADSAPTLAPKLEKPATRKARQVWGGKYADLTPPEPEERKA